MPFILSRTEPDFAVLLPLSLETARKSLIETPRKMELLAREKVVDAGAQGFVYFLEGVVDFVEKGNLKLFPVRTGAAFLPAVTEDSHGDEMPSFRYCTEVVLQGKGISRTDLIGGISRYGDYIVAGGGGERFRIHLHADCPAKSWNISRGREPEFFEKWTYAKASRSTEAPPLPCRSSDRFLL